MKPAIAFLAIVLASCAPARPAVWSQASWSQVPAQAADARCKYEATNLQGRDGGGWLYQAAVYNQAYQQCMAAAGWTAR